MEQKSLFDRLGGEPIIDQALTKLEEKIKADNTLGPMHQSVDFKKLHENRKTYLTNLFGGSVQYNGKNLTEAHKPYDLNDGHFNLFNQLLRQSLTELSVSQPLVDEVILTLEQTRSEVLDKKSLFERIGGHEVLSKAMDLLGQKIPADSVLGPIYAKTDLKKVNELRLQYLTELFGGKGHYTGKSMREAHSGHGNDLAFDRFIYIFQESLSELKVNSDAIKESIERLQAIRPEIVSKPSLFELLGGYEGLDKSLVVLQEKQDKDTTLAPYFANVDKEKLKERRKHYFAGIFGGPQTYTGRPMKEAHSGLKMDDQVFNLFLKYARQAFLEVGVKEEIANQAVETLDLTRDSVLGRQSVLERLGGKDGLHNIVERLHGNLLKDTVLGPIYEKADAQRMIKNYTNFLMYLFGGCEPHTDRSLTLAHRSLKLTNVHFDLFVRNFSRTLAQSKVDKDTITEAVGLLERRRNDVLQRQSLWIRLGGEQFMEKAVATFIERVVSDATLKPFHQNVDLKRYHETHKDFFAQVFGGYYLYSGRTLREAHGPLKLKDEHFNLFVKLFQDTLTQLGASQELVQEAVSSLELTRNEVLNNLSLYEKLGGEQTMEVLTEKLNKRLSEDPVLGPLHQNVDWTKLHLHRKQFFTQLFGHLNVYAGQDIRAAHSDLKLKDEHFDLFVKLFTSILSELGKSQELIHEAVTHVETTRREILNRTTLFDKLGGKAVVEKFVVTLDDILVKDSKLAPFFEKIDRKKLDDHQIQYFSMLFGNKEVTYEGKSMKTAHKSLPLSDEHFKIFVELSQKVLAQEGADKALINEVTEAFQTQRDEVISQ